MGLVGWLVGCRLVSFVQVCFWAAERMFEAAAGTAVRGILGSRMQRLLYRDFTHCKCGDYEDDEAFYEELRRQVTLVRCTLTSSAMRAFIGAACQRPVECSCRCHSCTCEPFSKSWESPCVREAILTDH